MTRYRHPRTIGRDDPAQFAVDLGTGERVVLDAEGCFESDDEGAVEALAQAHDLALSDLRVDATCDVEKADGEVCGRDLPCAYHSED